MNTLRISVLDTTGCLSGGRSDTEINKIVVELFSSSERDGKSQTGKKQNMA